MYTCIVEIKSCCRIRYDIFGIRVGNTNYEILLPVISLLLPTCKLIVIKKSFGLNATRDFRSPPT